MLRHLMVQYNEVVGLSEYEYDLTNRLPIVAVSHLIINVTLRESQSTTKNIILQIDIDDVTITITTKNDSHHVKI